MNRHSDKPFENDLPLEDKEPSRASSDVESSLVEEYSDKDEAELFAQAEDLAALDGMLRSGFEATLRATPEVAESRVDDIVDSLCTKPDFSVSRRMRRSVRTILWISALALSVVGAYAFIALYLRATGS